MRRTIKILSWFVSLSIAASLFTGCGHHDSYKIETMSESESKAYNAQVLQNMKNKDKGRKKEVLYNKYKYVNAFITKYYKKATYKIKKKMLGSVDKSVYGIWVGMKNDFAVRMYGEGTGKNFFSIRFYLTKPLGQSNYEYRVIKDTFRTMDKSIKDKDIKRVISACQKSKAIGCYYDDCKKVHVRYGVDYIDLEIDRDFR